MAVPPSLRQARFAQANRTMYARLSNTTRYQALKELSLNARSAISNSDDYKNFVRGIVDGQTDGIVIGTPRALRV